MSQNINVYFPSLFSDSKSPQPTMQTLQVNIAPISTQNKLFIACIFSQKNASFLKNENWRLNTNMAKLCVIINNFYIRKNLILL